MRRSLLLLPLSVLVAGLAVGQQPDKTPLKPIEVVKLDRKDPVLYEKDIEPILANKCQVCHKGNVQKADLDLGSYEGLMRGGKRGKSVVPGKSAESLLVKSAGRTQKPAMPPAKDVKGQPLAPLSPEELALIKLWIDQGGKAPTGVVAGRIVVVSVPPMQVHPVRALAISPDKSTVAAGRGNQIHVYDAVTGNLVKTLIDPNLTTPDKKPVQAAHLSIVESLAYSPDGKYIVSGSYREVIFWDAAEGTIKRKQTDFADRVVALAFSPDGKWLATGGGAPTENGEVKVFEVETGKTVLDIKDLKNGHSDTVFGVCFSPDGSKLATCGADKFVKVWQLPGQPQDKVAYVAGLFANCREQNLPIVPHLLTATHSKDVTHQLWEIPGGRLLKTFEGHTHHVLDVGWKSDGKLLASAGGETPTATAPGVGVIKVWDYDKGEQARTIGGNTRQVTRLLFVGKTNTIVTCSGDQSVRMINVDNGGNVRNFPGSADYLYAVGVSPDGALVAAGGEEGVVRLYNGTNGQLVKTLQPPAAEEPKKP